MACVVLSIMCGHCGDEVLLWHQNQSCFQLIKTSIDTFFTDYVDITDHSYSTYVIVKSG